MGFADDRIAELRAIAEEDPYNQDTWEQLLGEISRGRKNEEQLAHLKDTYESLLSKFPTSAPYWREYCELEIDNGNEDAVKTLFSRCLLTCLDVDLWRAYVRFIRKVNDPRAAEGLPEIRQAFEFTLDHVGQDVRSGPVWQDYIAFLSGPKVGTPEFNALFGAAAEGQEETAKATALRRAYQRALLVPTQALDALWTGYERLETSGGNKVLGKRLIEEWRPKFQEARALLKERATFVDKLQSRDLPAPPGFGGARQARLSTAWRTYLAWEVENPQRLEPAVYQARVTLAFNQSLAAMPSHPEVWLEFATWHMNVGGGGAVAALPILDRASKTLPKVLAIRFVAAELHEGAGAIDAAKGEFEALVEMMEKPTTTSVAAATAAGDGSQQQQDGDGATTTAAQPPPAVINTLSAEQGTLVWIQYMRFIRRVEGIMAARKLFLRARKWSALRWEAFVASAALEWAHERNEKIPRNIYELGLKSFIGQSGYVLQYAGFLRGLGDVANTRALFERALTSTQPTDAVTLWDAYLRFEQEVGTLQAALEVEQRRREALKELKPINEAVRLTVLKYKVLDLWPGPESHFKSLLGDAAGDTNGYESDREQQQQHQQGPPPQQRYRQDRGGGGERDFRDYRELPHRGGGSFRDRDRGERDHYREREGGVPPQQRRRSSPPYRGGDRDNMRRERSRSPPPRRPYSPEPSRHFPRELGQLINSLPKAPDGPVPDVERVMEALHTFDFSLEGIAAHEAAATRERRRQRQVRQGGGGGGGATGGGVGGAALKRKMGEGAGGGAAAAVGNSDSDSSDDEDGGGGLDVYRMRRKQART